MSVLQFANRRRYDISCPSNVDKRRWAAMTCQWGISEVSQMIWFSPPPDEHTDRGRLNRHRSHFVG